MSKRYKISQEEFLTLPPLTTNNTKKTINAYKTIEIYLISELMPKEHNNMDYIGDIYRRYTLNPEKHEWTPTHNKLPEQYHGLNQDITKYPTKEQEETKKLYNIMITNIRNYLKNMNEINNLLYNLKEKDKKIIEFSEIIGNLKDKKLQKEIEHQFDLMLVSREIEIEKL